MAMARPGISCCRMKASSRGWNSFSYRSPAAGARTANDARMAARTITAARGVMGRRGFPRGRSRLLARDDRQHDVGRRLLGVMHAVVRHLPRRLVEITAAGIEISVEARKVRAADFKPDAMPGRKVVAGRIHRHVADVDLARFHPDFLVKALTITRA